MYEVQGLSGSQTENIEWLPGILDGKKNWGIIFRGYWVLVWDDEKVLEIASDE